MEPTPERTHHRTSVEWLRSVFWNTVLFPFRPLLRRITDSLVAPLGDLLLSPPPNRGISREAYELINRLPEESEQERQIIAERLDKLLATQIDIDENRPPPSTP